MSGMALISVTLMMFLLNNNVAAAMVVGIAVCVAIGQGADMMQDLKTGYMIGGRPVKQQIAQFCVTWMGALLAAGAIYVLWHYGPKGTGAGGFGEGSPLPAPQAAFSWASLTRSKAETFHLISTLWAESLVHFWGLRLWPVSAS